jgi:hypothetical protein
MTSGAPERRAEERRRAKKRIVGIWKILYGTEIVLRHAPGQQRRRHDDPLSLLSTFLGALDDDFALACLASSLLWLT